MKCCSGAILQLILGLSFLASHVFGQTPVAPPYDPSPFQILGTIDAMTLDSTTTNPLRGGTITVDGNLITVPTNLLAQTFALTSAWAEFFTNGVVNLPGNVTWEAHVLGNRVGNLNIAGQVFISQKFAQLLEGFVTSINIATGHFTVGASNFDCVLNDPVGRFGIPHRGNELWASDPDNPSIIATNGFPLCIPRTSTADDPLCPTKNRPKDALGNPLTVFTFKDPSLLAATDPDPRQMAPLLVGDYVTVLGTEINGTLWVNSLNANLGIFTAAGSKPAYVTVESVQFGIVTTQDGAEIAQSSAVAWTTDVGGGLLDWFAIDVDPCTGVETQRSLNIPTQPNMPGNPPLGLATFRDTLKVSIGPATRQVGFVLKDTGTSIGAGNITAGQSTTPVFNFVFPELLNTGSPELVLAFDVIPYLVFGSGPYVPGLLGFPAPVNTPIVGQLSPWPGSPVPAATSCPPPISATSIGSSPVSTTLTTSVATTTAPPPPRDTITITSAVATNGKGVTTLVVTATTTSKDPTIVLFITAAGPNPIGLTPMTLVSPGNWMFSVEVKGRPTTVTVTSSFGGGPVTAAVTN